MLTTLSSSSRTLAWFRVMTLAFAAFIFNTTEFLPVALLSNIATSFHMTAAQTGIMITIYAWVVAAMSLPLMLFTSQIERRKLLTALFILFILSHILSGFAWSFTVLLISRIGVALAHALFWSITASLAIRVAPAGKKAQALGLLSVGTAMATVLGLPLGRVIGQWLGWRATFLSIAVIALCTLFALRYCLPLLPSQRSGSLRSLPTIFKQPALVGIFILTLLVVTAHFSAYSYIEPFVQQIAHLSSHFTTLLLLIFGAAGVLGGIIFSQYYSKIPLHFLPSALLLLTLCLISLSLIHNDASSLVILCLFWGIASMCFSLGLQVKVIELSPDATDLAMAIYSGTFNIGIGGGALLGGQLSIHYGMANIGYFGVILSTLAFIWCCYLFKRYSTIFKQTTENNSMG